MGQLRLVVEGLYWLVKLEEYYFYCYFCSMQKTNRFLKAPFSPTPDKCKPYLYYTCQGWGCQQEKAPTLVGAFVMVIKGLIVQ